MAEGAGAGAGARRMTPRPGPCARLLPARRRLRPRPGARGRRRGRAVKPMQVKHLMRGIIDKRLERGMGSRVPSTGKGDRLCGGRAAGAIASEPCGYPVGGSHCLIMWDRARKGLWERVVWGSKGIGEPRVGQPPVYEGKPRQPRARRHTHARRAAAAIQAGALVAAVAAVTIAVNALGRGRPPPAAAPGLETLACSPKGGR